ncbi:vWA domain-containing protein [Halorientalis pallida]|uniref:vWA domain-containing protein n=1 Tax=Halorientalis pallida TaxID=2479928 RepID=UPI003C6ECF7B
MTGDRCLLTGDERGVSEVIAYSLIIGIAALGSILVVVFGGGVLDQATSQNQQQSAELVLQEMDSRLSTLSQLDDIGAVEFNLGGAAPESLSTREGGTVNVTVNRNVSRSGPDCRAVVGFDTVEYQTEDGNRIAYEAGGVFKGGRDNGSSLVTPPSLTFRNGSLSISVVNMSGRVTAERNEAVLNVGTSRTQSENASSTVLDGPCIRPNNVTIKVQSDYYRAWGAHMETEFGNTARVETFEENRTAFAYVPQDGLPRSLDDEVNRVVNLSGASYMTVAKTVKDDSDSLPPYVEISKEDATTTLDNRYRVNIRPLANGSFMIGNTTTVTTVTTSNPKTRDVVFVLDDSGSMACLSSNAPSEPECQYLSNYGEEKIESAKTAAKAGGIAALNATDRAGIVGYDDTARYPGAGDHAYLTRNFEAVNDSIDTLTANSQTCINCGLNAALRAFSATGGQSQNRSVVLLSDGKNTASGASDSATLDAAQRAADRGIVIHTVAFGSGADTGLLEDIADITGGQYEQTGTPDEVREFFREAVTNPVSEDRVRLTAMTTNATAGGGLDGVRAPYLTGETGQISFYEAGGTEFPNINDPKAPSTFRHSFAVEDGEKVFLGASWYGCEEWRVLSLQADGKRVSRCAKLNEDNMHNVSEENVGIYLDGYDAESNLFDRSNPRSYSWQTPFHEHIEELLVDTDGDGDGDELELASNQALVVYNFSISGEPEDRYNRLPVIYEVGLSEDAVQPEDVINIQVRNVRVD